VIKRFTGRIERIRTFKNENWKTGGSQNNILTRSFERNLVDSLTPPQEVTGKSLFLRDSIRQENEEFNIF